MWFFNFMYNELVRYIFIEMSSWLVVTAWILIAIALHRIDGDSIDDAGLPEDRALRKKFFITFIIIAGVAATTWTIIIGLGEAHSYFT